ncbi:hypothetical protein ACGF3G_10715 [Streptomyces sp. NPDC048179]|uniref:hypothetical protein n=1 Tax=Streptomyces sp. NPDC048179 TaxID=3365506 RepID=UPI003712A42F
MWMNDLPGVIPQRSNAPSNRARILEAAQKPLHNGPDVALDSIAHAACVVRRTVYGHFRGRHELLTALAQEAS